MGKTYSIYLTEEETKRVNALIKIGVSKVKAIKKVLYDEDKTTQEKLDSIIRLLENIRSLPVLQVGVEKQFIKVELPKEGFWERMKFWKK